MTDWIPIDEWEPEYDSDGYTEDMYVYLPLFNQQAVAYFDSEKRWWDSMTDDAIDGKITHVAPLLERPLRTDRDS